MRRTTTMWVAKTIEQVRQHRKQTIGTVALVPTLGALHEGHLALIRAARSQGDHTLVSIFVNPTQFGPDEDYERYPRPLDQDLAACEREQVAGVFAPEVNQMYPPGQPAAQVQVPALAADLEGACRPGHFAGVCRVVAKLFNLIQPDVAMFGQKDYQQLRIIEAMVADLAMPIRIVAVPTVREADGLALSSRNAYLDAAERRHALGLFKALREAEVLIEQGGETDPAAVERTMQQVLEAHQVQVDYAVVRHPRSLAKLDSIDPTLSGGVVALVAGRLSNVRLIDNMIIGRDDDGGAGADCAT
ncbi:MAG: pantoate--beta-alanine ligase [Phycisphaeraceae bacterium]